MRFFVSSSQPLVSNPVSQDTQISDHPCPSLAQQLAVHVCHDIGETHGAALQALAAYRYHPNLHVLDSNHRVLTYLHPDGLSFKVAGTPAKEHAFNQAYEVKNWETGRSSLKVRPIQNEAGQVVWMHSESVGLKGGAPQARVDLKDEFEVDDSDEEINIVYTAIEHEHFLNATVRNNVLNFYVRAEGDASTFGSGKDMFISLMNRLEEESIRVDKIQAEWEVDSDSVNTAVFLENLGRGLSPKAAAHDTWTGRLVAQYGFSPRSIEKRRNCYYVMFKKG